MLNLLKTQILYSSDSGSGDSTPTPPPSPSGTYTYGQGNDGNATLVPQGDSSGNTYDEKG